MSKNEKKRQHVIPASYLRAWLDPSTPAVYEAFIWRIPKDGGAPYRRSPEKSFRSNNRYTITLKEGERDLTVEDTLATLESRFVSLRQRIANSTAMSARDHATRCLFDTAMHTRTIRMGDPWAHFHQQVLDLVEPLERQHGIQPTKSNELKESIARAAPEFVMLNLEVQAPLLMRLNYSILITNDPVGFITSDSPCVWHLPNAHRMPPTMRHPALMHQELEITFPLSPRQMLLLSHIRREPFKRVSKGIVDELNRRTRFYCEKEIVSRSNAVDRIWFSNGEMPEDSWEFTEEGRTSQAKSEAYERMRANMI